MIYTKKVIDYFNNDDLREQEDLANQIENGSYQDELKGLSQADMTDLLYNLRNNYEPNSFQRNALKKINHIGAYIVLASLED